jgi:hypothetical protein
MSNELITDLILCLPAIIISLWLIKEIVIKLQFKK